VEAGKSPVKNSRRARLDIDYVDRHLDQVVHRSTGRFNDAINA
jgi:hypothetical protein